MYKQPLKIPQQNKSICSRTYSLSSQDTSIKIVNSSWILNVIQSIYMNIKLMENLLESNKIQIH